MSIFGSILRTVAPLALTALTGGAAAPFLAMAMKQIGSAIAQQVIQKLGQQFGLPQGVIGMAQNAFAAATGSQGMSRSVDGAISQLAQQFGLTPTQQGELARTANDSARDIMDTVSQFDYDGSNRASGKQSWVMALVKALGPKLDSLANKMTTLAGQAKDSPSKAAEFQAVSQEFNLLMTSLTGAIKTIGEAQATAARKG